MVGEPLDCAGASDGELWRDITGITEHFIMTLVRKRKEKTPPQEEKDSQAII